jgi:CcmD family protein
MAYLAAAFLVIWLCSFVFIFSMVQRQRSLRREIEMLKQASGAEERARQD